MYVAKRGEGGGAGKYNLILLFFQKKNLYLFFLPLRPYYLAAFDLLRERGREKKEKWYIFA